MKTINNDKQFSSTLTAVGKSTAKMVENVQALLDYGFEHYQDHGAVSYLNRVVNNATKYQPRSVKQLQKYIKASTNLVASKTKSGDFTFKSGDKTKDRYTPVEGETWYTFEKEPKAPVASDLLKDLEAFIKRASKKIESDLGVTNKAQAIEILNGLRNLANEVKPETAILKEAA